MSCLGLCETMHCFMMEMMLLLLMISSCIEGDNGFNIETVSTHLHCILHLKQL